ncbi:MAG: hypothetical protein ACI4Q6_00940 [Huintestinicola sp.]
MEYKGYINKEEALECFKQEQSGMYRWKVAIEHNVSESTLIRAYKKFNINYKKYKNDSSKRKNNDKL